MEPSLRRDPFSDTSTTPLVRALACAFRWREMLETRVYATVGEIASAEKIDLCYASRVLRLTLLAPDIVEVILDRRQPAEMTLAGLMRPFAVDWEQQRGGRLLT